MLEWFDSTAALFCERDGMVDMSGLDSDDVLVVWVQVPPLVSYFVFYWEFTSAIFNFF